MGLSTAQANDRLVAYGRNEIVKKKNFKWLLVLFSLWKSPLIWLLVVASLLTVFFGHYKDAIMIMATVVLNTVVGFFQEHKAEKSLESFKSVLSAKVEAFRDGERKTISASELVPGDIIFVSNKHRIAADGVIVSNENLQTVEAELTGESTIVEKEVWEKTESIVDIELALSMIRDSYETMENKNKVFMGTLVKTGVAKILVVRTGKETEIGKIADQVKAEKEELTPLQKKIQGLTKYLTVIVLLIAGVVVLHGWYTKESLMITFPLAVALVTAALPEGLVISFTVVLTVGMQRILKKGGLVRHMASAEALGSVQVICSDKTGTITEGVMRVTQAVTNLKGTPTTVEHEDIILAAILCNDMRDPLELAMNEWANKEITKLKGKIKVDSYERIDSRPFNSQDKIIVTLLKTANSDNSLLISGAPERVLARTDLSQAEKQLWSEKIKELAGGGFRLVGFAGKKTKDKKMEAESLCWQGLIVYEDPIRSGVKKALERVREAGVAVKIITGDYKETAVAIARQIGMKIDDSNVMTGDELSALTQEELVKLIEKITVFARTTPEQKLRIVEALQTQNLIVAMTGDGMNDAPAIKKADVGIVMSEATEVAKEIADLILIKNDFETIVEMVEEGRSILNNFKKVLVYLLSGAFVTVLIVLASVLLNWPLPLLVPQILWVHMISEGFPYLALTLEPKESGLLKLKPKDFGGSLVTSEMSMVIVLVSVLTATSALGVFYWYLFGLGQSLVYAQTMTMTMVAVSALIYVFSTKSLNKSIFMEKATKNIWLIVGVILGWLMILSALYIQPLQRILGTTAINFGDWSVIFTGVLVILGVLEIKKLVFSQFFKSKQVV